MDAREYLSRKTGGKGKKRGAREHVSDAAVE
jgi:hypothetical protein